MASLLTQNIPELSSMGKYPDRLYYEGSTELLSKPKISIVGTRHPTLYTQGFTLELAKKIASSGVVVVSGAAMGVDALAHQGAGVSNTIAILPNGINIRYPAQNKKLIQDIGNHGLLLSQFDPDFTARDWSFVVRNELVVALGDVLIVTEAEMGSGSMRSVEFALEMGKPIYVLPHRLSESSGTRRLLAEGRATAIDDINQFVSKITKRTIHTKIDTPFLVLCRKMPTYEEAVTQFPKEVFEGELSGVIEVKNGRIMVVD